MNEGVFFCIDAGTTRFKTAAITPRGELVARKNVTYASNAASISGDVHEYRIEELTGAFLDSLRAVLGELGGEPVLGMGITGHGPTLIPVDRNGGTIHPAVGYLDDRVKSYIRRVADSKDQKITSTMYIPIALFFKEELPRIYEQTHTFFQPFDFLSFLLTGQAVASSSSSGIKPWELEAIDSAGLDAHKFPPIRYMGEEIGRTTRSSAGRSGIPPDTPVYAIGVDFAAALVGTNMLFQGRSCERAGSSGGINLCWNRPIRDDRLLCYEHFVRGTYNVAGITSTYGKALEWARKVLQVSGFEMERSKRGPTGIVFLPYLKGERTPLWDPYAKGGFFGMGRDSDAMDLMISVYTGVALSIRDCIDIMESAGCEFRYPVMSTGGLTDDDWFMQLKADVTGKTFSRAHIHDAELLGIAIVLAAARALYPSLTEAASALVREEDSYVPRTDLTARYGTLFQRYRKLRNLLTRHF